MAYLSNERKAGLSGELLEIPFVSPDIVIEILSPDDRAAGVRLVLIVDPDERTIEAFDAAGRTTYLSDSTFTTARFSNLVIDVAALFSELDD